MKFVWDDGDIKGGRRFAKPGTREVWMIGYVDGEGGKNGIFAFISLTDGLVGIARTRSQMVGDLNDGGYAPAEFLEWRE